MRQCRVSGCAKQSEGYSSLCGTHKRRQRRHGSPTQTTISTKQLQGHREATKRWLDGRPEANGWGPLRTLFGHMADEARAQLALTARQASARYLRQAHQDVVTVSGESSETVDSAALAVAAMFALRDSDPRLFVSDDAFRVQLARRFRAISDVNVAVTWSQADRKSKRVYRDASSRRLISLGQFLSVALGALSMTIGAAMAEEADRKAQERREAFEAVRKQLDGEHGRGTQQEPTGTDRTAVGEPPNERDPP
jgi:hypothetical protein